MFYIELMASSKVRYYRCTGDLIYDALHSFSLS